MRVYGFSLASSVDLLLGISAAVQALAPTPPNDTDREADADDAPSSTGAPA